VVIRDDFRRRVDQSQLDAMAVWFRSALGRKITALEIAASNPDATPKIAAFAAGLKTSPATAGRLDLVQRFDWVTGTSQETTDLALAIAGSVARAVAAATPAERRARAGSWSAASRRCAARWPSPSQRTFLPRCSTSMPL